MNLYSLVYILGFMSMTVFLISKKMEIELGKSIFLTPEEKFYFDRYGLFFFFIVCICWPYFLILFTRR